MYPHPESIFIANIGAYNTGIQKMPTSGSNWLTNVGEIHKSIENTLFDYVIHK